MNVSLIKEPFLDFKRASFTSPKKKSSEIRSVKLLFQNDSYQIDIISKENTHTELKSANDIVDFILKCISEFKQCLIETNEIEYQVLINKKNEINLISLFKF